MNKAEFFTASAEKAKATKVLELSDGRKVNYRRLSQAEVETIMRDYRLPEAQAAGLRYMVCRAVLDDAGNRMFTDDDMGSLQAVDYQDIQAISTAVSEFTGMAKPVKN